MDALKMLKFIEIGLRPAEVPIIPRRYRKNVEEACHLIPTHKGEWIIESLRKKVTEWDGVHIPLIIYKNGTASILVPHGEEEWEEWKKVRDKIQEVLGIHVKIVGD